MKSVFFAAIAMIATVVVAQDGTTSVLTNQPTPAAGAATTTVAATPVECCEEAKVAKLAPWQVRRLNRIADRQEAREARKCCCDPCACEKEDACKCKCKTRAVVVEARR